MPPRGHSSSSHSSSSRSHSSSSRSFSRSSSSRSYSRSNRSSWRSDRYSDSAGFFSGSDRYSDSESDDYLSGSDRSYDDSLNDNSGAIAFIVIIIGVVILWMAVYVFRAIRESSMYSEKEPAAVSETEDGSGTGQAGIANTEIFGRELFLDKTGKDSYTIVTEADDFEKKLRWSDEYQSYYDPESDCYLWYNNNVTPNLWQYWYEGISSDYEEYGWMEYEPDGWFIEESDSSWVELPAQYDTSKLWHIEEKGPKDEGDNTEEAPLDVEVAVPINDNNH